MSSMVRKGKINRNAYDALSNFLTKVNSGQDKKCQWRATNIPNPLPTKLVIRYTRKKAFSVSVTPLAPGGRKYEI